MATQLVSKTYYIIEFVQLRDAKSIHTKTDVIVVIVKFPIPSAHLYLQLYA